MSSDKGDFLQLLEEGAGGRDAGSREVESLRTPQIQPGPRPSRVRGLGSAMGVGAQAGSMVTPALLSSPIKKQKEAS